MPCQASDVEIAAIPSSWYFIVLLLIWRLTAPDPDPLKLSRMSNLASYVYAHEKQTAVLSGGFTTGSNMERLLLFPLQSAEFA